MFLDAFPFNLKKLNIPWAKETNRGYTFCHCSAKLSLTSFVIFSDTCTVSKNLALYLPLLTYHHDS